MKWGHGEGRTVHDGTWGWDETGHSLFRRRVILGWSEVASTREAPAPIKRMGRSFPT